MNNTMLTCKILKESNSNMISFDKILNKNSYKNTKIISYQNEVELETIKTLDFLDILNKNQKEPSPYPENYIEIVKNRASKEKNQKFQRNSLKLIKENSLNLNSNRFETDNDTETEQNLQNMKRSSKKKEISVPVPIKPEFEKDFP